MRADSTEIKRFGPVTPEKCSVEAKEEFTNLPQTKTIKSVKHVCFDMVTALFLIEEGMSARLLKEIR